MKTLNKFKHSNKFSIRTSTLKCKLNLSFCAHFINIHRILFSSLFRKKVNLSEVKHLSGFSLLCSLQHLYRLHTCAVYSVHNVFNCLYQNPHCSTCTACTHVPCTVYIMYITVCTRILTVALVPLAHMCCVQCT